MNQPPRNPHLEAELHQIVREFIETARSTRSEKDAPVTVAEMNHMITQFACMLDTMISKLV